jgi:hypothetical protein
MPRPITEYVRLRDLRVRLASAEQNLDLMAMDAPTDVEMYRLQGKASGVGLALSYVDEMLRESAQIDGALVELRRVWRDGGDVLLHEVAGTLRDTTRINELRAAIDQALE